MSVDPTAAEVDMALAETLPQATQAREEKAELHFAVGRPLALRLGYPAELLDGIPAEGGERPERFEYRLTKKGAELRVVLLALMQWGDRHLSDKPPKIARGRSDRPAPAPPRSCPGQAPAPLRAARPEPSLPDDRSRSEGDQLDAVVGTRSRHRYCRASGS
jgi:hypothetical protein